MTPRARGPLAALALLALAAPPAVADAATTHYGDCRFDTVSVADDPYRGAIYAAVVLWSPTHGNVVDATVTCTVTVNGVPRASATGSGTGTVLVAGDAEFTSGDTDTVAMCTTVDITSDSTPTTTSCETASNYAPPQTLEDRLPVLIDRVNGTVDPAVCPVLASLAPGAGPVAIDAQGDGYLDGELFWDCPPYADGSGPAPPLVDVPGPDEVEPPDALRGPTGLGYSTGDAGFLALVSPETTTVPVGQPDDPGGVAAACAFRGDGATVEVTGAATAVADGTRIRCRLVDATTGAVLYDETAVANAPAVALRGTVAATGNPVTVCTEGTGVRGTEEVTTGLACRPGAPV